MPLLCFFHRIAKRSAAQVIRLQEIAAVFLYCFLKEAFPALQAVSRKLGRKNHQCFVCLQTLIPFWRELLKTVKGEYCNTPDLK